MSDAADATIAHAFEPVLPAQGLATSLGDARAVALISDIMLASRIEPAGIAAGCRIDVVADSTAVSAALSSPAAAVILDLTDPAFPFDETYTLIRALAPAAAVLAFFPHVRDDLGTKARSAGCDLVMPRSRFMTDPASAVRSALQLAARDSDAAPTGGGDS
jgi:DNA-binding NarL/FixJ family response regulator